MVKQFVQIWFSLFFTSILHLSFRPVFIEKKCFKIHHKRLYSNFPIVQFFLDCICTPFSLLVMLSRDVEVNPGTERKSKTATQSTITSIVRSSNWMCSVRKGVLRNFAKFTGKHVCQSLLFNKVAGCNFI